jgi:dienelactone hydrolase
MKEQKVLFKNSKGQNLVGVVHIPDGDGPFPVVIVCHGFKGRMSEPQISRLAEDLVKAGFVSLKFDFSNNIGESDGEFENITVTQEIDDLNHAIEFVKTLAYANGQIGITGHSLGGMVCSLTASKRNDIKCFVSLSSAFNFKETRPFKVDEESKKRGYFLVYSKTLKKEFRVNFEFYEDGTKQDTVEAAKKIRCPTLVVHGTDDKTIPVQQAKDLFETLQCEKELFIVEGASHVFRDEPSLAKVSAATVEWFKKWLK